MEFPEITAENGRHKVILSYDGEGFDGDFGEAENDEPLVRYTIFFDDEPVQDGSNCTRFSWQLLDRDKLAEIANTILEVAQTEKVENKLSKRAEQQLSTYNLIEAVFGSK